ncbi:MAG: hypothetical protein JNL58_02130 [Planctomyces sp.]|nr:hypothetical protein [Planctomyces sp.]
METNSPGSARSRRFRFVTGEFEEITVIRYSIMVLAALVSLSPVGMSDSRAAVHVVGGTLQEQTAIQISAPRPWQVVQRKGFVPGHSHENQPGGPAMGFGDVRVVLNGVPSEWTPLLEYRIRDLKTDDNAQAHQTSAAFQPLITSAVGGGADSATQVAAELRLPAGGWYRLDVRVVRGEEILAEATVEPIGVGEVFVVAGQSYATNCNDRQFQVEDQRKRVSAWNWRTGEWQLANDPQPCADESTGGTIWPVTGDMLVSVLNVPVGFVNVAYGGTSSQQWMPDGDLHNRLMAAAGTIGSCRAVLWQQGESDVIANASTEEYVQRMRTIRDHAATAWEYPVPWMLAKSTLHPTVYVRPTEEQRIRDGIEQLILKHEYLRGPDTDILGAENRGGPDTRRHFSEIGQRRAASMWFASIMQHVMNPQPDDDRVASLLSEMNLSQAPWNSSLVWRESSILFKRDGNSLPVARLGFPAVKILEVRSADGRQRFSEGRHYRVSEDRLSLIFMDSGKTPVIAESDLFVPRDSPNSYRHRTSNPEQNLLYAPGRWFHDRNIEITYERADVADQSTETPSEPGVYGSLERIRQRLKSGQRIRLGVSGDSISTGLDASALTYAWPNQPGYPDLVAAELQAVSGAGIDVTNRAVAGWSVANGVQDLDALLQSEPHLVIIAYGMNDVGRKDPKWFREQTQLMIERIQKQLPQTDIALVSPMLGNSEWVHTPREMFALYRNELKSLCGPGVAMADVTAVWSMMLEHKHDHDLTGNGLNHPNDYGHRLYAMTILELFKDIKVSDGAGAQ